MAPPAPADPNKRAPAGATFSWIRLNFGQCPEGANRDTLRTYTRVYLWYMISRTLFADSGGKLAHWCWLKALTVLEHRWSWGTAALAYLYRQLDEACRRTGSGGIGGSLLLLSVWSWDRLSVGRTRILNVRPWPHHRNNLDREPTWAYLWDNVSEMSSDPKIMYMHYTEELDTLTAEQECPPQWQDTDQALHSNYLQWFHQNTSIELVKHAYDDDILDDPIEFDEVAQSQHDIYARKGRSTSIASELNFVGYSIDNQQLFGNDGFSMGEGFTQATAATLAASLAVTASDGKKVVQALEYFKTANYNKAFTLSHCWILVKDTKTGETSYCL
ncbi:uncharacterized protein LOC124657080 [Lolium rigidum]|uniref:uncharacterized protein LOC124657080 n=1 Tax=Lolium rigidum TaxID=89674 RepID=UPI001F5C56A3|nr:uncharacterized protein LOC124657080 [Lolium rigidum]